MSYVDAFILVAPDSALERTVVPTARGGKPTIAQLEYELLSQAPYRRTEAEVQFAVHLARLGLSPAEADDRHAALKREFFSRLRACFAPRPCRRSSGGVSITTRREDWRFMPSKATPIADWLLIPR